MSCFWYYELFAAFSKVDWHSVLRTSVKIKVSVVEPGPFDSYFSIRWLLT